MSVDLTLLVWSVAVAVGQTVLLAVGAMQQVGLPMLAGNRENMPALTGWADRAGRAHRNMLESLVLFAALVLIAHVTGKANAMTALGAQLFFWGRLIYAGVYIAGVPWLRTGIWVVALAGLILIFLQLV